MEAELVDLAAIAAAERPDLVLVNAADGQPSFGDEAATSSTSILTRHEPPCPSMPSGAPRCDWHRTSRSERSRVVGLRRRGCVPRFEDLIEEGSKALACDPLDRPRHSA